jgi:hypothetical protein
MLAFSINGTLPSLRKFYHNMIKTRHILIVLASLTFVRASFAQSPPPPNPRAAVVRPAFQVSLLTDVLDLSPSLALQFVRKFREAAPDQQGAVLAELMQQYATREDPQHHRSISSLAVTVPDGQRATIEIIREYRYPTEFAFKNGFAMPMAFETRNIGTTAELEALRAPDGKTWDVMTVFQLVHLAEVKIYGQGFLAVEQPIFSTRKLSTRVTLQPGVPRFVGVVGPDPQVDGQSKEPVRIVILTAVVPEAVR